MSKVHGHITRKGVKGTITQNGAFNWSYYWLTRYPSVLSLTDNGELSITLNWTNNGTGYDGIKVERSADGVAYSVIATLGVVVTYTDTAPADGTFYYRIRYYKGTSYSAYSNIDSIAVESWNPALSTPSAVIAVPYSGTRIDLFWTNNGAQTYDHISIEGSTDGVTYSEYETVAAGETSANVTGLTQVTDYWFRIRVVKGGSASPYSNVVQTLTYPTDLFDGHILLWIPHEDTSLYTLDGVNVNEVADKLGSGKKFIGGTVKPTRTADGIYFPDASRMTATFNFNAQYTMYIVMALHEFRAYAKIMQLRLGNQGIVFEDANNKYYYLNGATGAAQRQQLALDTYGVFMIGCKASTTTGFFRIDDNVADEGFVGLTDNTSITFLSEGVIGNMTNLTLKEIILSDTYDLGTDKLTNIYNYLVKKKL